MNAAVLLGLLLAQASPAPGYPAASPPDPANRVAVFAHLSHRLASSENQLTPTFGFSIGGEYQHRYLRLDSVDGPSLHLAVAASFFHDRFSTAQYAPPASNGMTVALGDRLISQTGFALCQVVSLPISVVRPFVAGGAGVTLGYFSSPEPELRPGSKSALQPLITGSVGLAIAINNDTEIGLHAVLIHPLTHPTFTPAAGPTLALFGDLLDIGVGLFYRF
jgi:hypothetical protein